MTVIVELIMPRNVSVHCSCPAGINESLALLHSIECFFEHTRNSLLVAPAVGESKKSQECEWLKPRKKKLMQPMQQIFCM